LSYVPDSGRRHDTLSPHVDPGSIPIVVADAGEPLANPP